MLSGGIYFYRGDTLRITDDLTFGPDYDSGGWVVEYCGQPGHFRTLNEAIEATLELALVISIEHAAESQAIATEMVLVKDAVEAMRSLLMNWYQLQNPDPAGVINLNEIKNLDQE